MSAALATATRQRARGYIDSVPESRLPVLISFLEILTNNEEPIIEVETDLTDEEIEMLREDRDHRKNHPEDYVSLDEARKIIYGEKV